MPLKEPLGLAIVEEDANIEARDRQQYFTFILMKHLTLYLAAFFSP